MPPTPAVPHLAYKFRLSPNATQVVALEQQLETLRNVYNAALAWWRDAYRYEKDGRGQIIPRKAKKGGGERKAGLVEVLRPIICGMRNLQLAEQKAGVPGPHWLSQVGATPIRDTIARVQKAFDRFYDRCRTGAKKKGYPRFKGRGHMRSIPFDNIGSGCSFREPGGRAVLTGVSAARTGYRLDVFGVGRIKVRIHRDIAGRIKTASVKREPDGKWYVVLNCEHVAVEVPPKEGPAVGVDVGLEHFATTSDGEHVPNPRFLKLSLPRLRVLQRAASRKVEAAKKAKRKFRECRNLQRASRNVARQHVRVSNQRKEFHRQQSNRLVGRYATVCVESLNVRGMVRTHKLSRAIADAGWSAFVGTLKHTAAKAGVSVAEVDPSGTSQTCPECGAVAKKELRERVHSCSCGCTLHRDHAAALVILARGTNGAGSVPARQNVAPLPTVKAVGKGKRAGRNLPAHRL